VTTTLLRSEKAALPTAESAPNFDRLARVYGWMEALSFGPWLRRCRCAFLEEIKDCKRALVLGDGDGRFTARLLRENPVVEIDAVDMSPAMLNALVRRAGVNRHRVRTQVADLRSWSPELPDGGEGRDYDLVVSHFFLDCLTTAEVETLAARVRPLLADDAVWVVSEFAVPAGWFGRWVALPVVGFLYRAFGWMTGLRVRELPDYACAFERAGLQLERRRNWMGGLLVSECWSDSGSGDQSA
jgi:SAM-dependent methyltransferase